MVFNKTAGTEKVVILDCDCGCDNMIKFKKLDDISDDIFVSFCVGSFYTKQKGIFKTIFLRLKFAIMILFGKEYMLEDVVMKKSDCADLVTCLNSLMNNGKSKLEEEKNK